MLTLMLTQVPDEQRHGPWRRLRLLSAGVLMASWGWGEPIPGVFTGRTGPTAGLAAHCRTLLGVLRILPDDPVSLISIYS